MVTSSASAGSPVGSGVFQLTPNSVRSTVVDSTKPDALVPVGSVSRMRAPCRSRSTGFVTPLIVISPRTVDVVAVEVDLVGREAELRVALGVEEVRRLQVRGEVLVLDVDARDLGRALSVAPLVADVERRLDLAELALEGARRCSRPRSRRPNGPGRAARCRPARRSRSLWCSCACPSCLSACTIEYASKCSEKRLSTQVLSAQVSEEIPRRSPGVDAAAPCARVDHATAERGAAGRARPDDQRLRGALRARARRRPAA